MNAPKRRWSLLNTDVRDLFKRQGRLVDEVFLKECFAVLANTDMGAESAQAIVDEVGARFRARVVEMDDLLASVRAKLKELMPER